MNIWGNAWEGFGGWGVDVVAAPPPAPPPAAPPPAWEPPREPLPHTGTMLCGECLGSRGMLPYPDSGWIFSTCDICLRDRSIASPLLAVHHTLAEVPLDTGGADGID